jgi:hypothetical protein
MGQKIDCLGLRGTTRSRQDEPNEVHEAGRIWTPSGCNGVHVLSLCPLIWRSLCTAAVVRWASAWIRRGGHPTKQVPLGPACAPVAPPAFPESRGRCAISRWIQQMF